MINVIAHVCYSIVICMLFEVYEHDKFMLTRRELIFYYERLTVRGLCISVLADFQREISSDGYSLLRLVRPSENDPEKALLLSQAQQQHLANFTNFVEGQLTKRSHNFGEGVELIGRDGRDPPPNLNTSRPRLAVDNFNARSRNQQPGAVIPPGKVTYEMLLQIPNLSIARLLEIGTAEGVNLKRHKKGRMIKSDYMDAFVDHRANAVAHETASGESKNEEAHEIASMESTDEEDEIELSGSGNKRPRAMSDDDDDDDV